MSTYEISKSSLLSLKAEILKKQEELQKAKVENKIKEQRLHRTPLELKNKGVENRAENDGFQVDEDLLQKSRIALEAKSKLYEKLSKGSRNEVEREHNRQYLVHFDKKAKYLPDQWPEENDDEDNYPEEGEINENDYVAENSDDEWVEFVDCFGRTRTCLKKDLNSFKKKDKELQSNKGKRPEKATSFVDKQAEIVANDENAEEFDEKNELLSGDMRRELLRRQWEQEEEQLKDKSNVHYQDILFSEARSHGVGYYGFSKDEAARATQQEALKNLRKETEQQQKLAQEVRQSREKQMAARIRAAKNRKRAREGLPPITSDDEQEEEETKATNTQEQSHEQAQPVVPSREDIDKEMKRKMHVRPWDIGKEDPNIEEARIKSGSRDPYNQEEWNRIQRTKRNQEFAPPQTYYAKSSSIRSRSGDSPHVNPYKTVSSSMPVHTPFRNECTSSSGDDSESEDELLKDFARTRSGSNIPPPATYDYYGPSSSASKRAKSSAHAQSSNMEDSIMQGLRYLREQIEGNKH